MVVKSKKTIFNIILRGKDTTRVSFERMNFAADMVHLCSSVEKNLYLNHLDRATVTKHFGPRKWNFDVRETYDDSGVL